MRTYALILLALVTLGAAHANADSLRPGGPVSKPVLPEPSGGGHH